MKRDTRLAWTLLAPMLIVLAAIALAPLVMTIWESLHRHDLRMPWIGRPYIGLANYATAAADARFGAALLHTAVFTGISVALELTLGLLLALALDNVRRGRGAARLIVLLPWALPTVVAALVWRFLFESPAGLLAFDVEWLSRPIAAWVPIVLADVWKSTPFVALLLLAGLQAIDPALYDAARLDGATAWRRFTNITLPLLRPALLVALIFRTLDAFRVFDVVYVLTGGGPGTATEVVSLYAFTSLLQELRFGYGSALSVTIFGVTFMLALLYIRALGAPVAEDA